MDNEDVAKPILKKCPWCGRRPTLGKGQRYKTDSEPGSILPHKAGDWFFKPGIRHGRGGKCRIVIHIEADSVEEVIEIWNTRKG